eukprot:SAG31_NODE_40097_length_283_cov_0.842391_1_plen_32_part_01
MDDSGLPMKKPRAVKASDHATNSPRLHIYVII